MINKAIKEYLLNHGKDEYKELAAATGLTVRAIKKFFKDNSLLEPKQESVSPAPVPVVEAKDAIVGVQAIHTIPLTNPTNGATIMTEQAAQWADEVIKGKLKNIANDDSRVFKRPAVR